jgi:hypothetical protein
MPRRSVAGGPAAVPLSNRRGTTSKNEDRGFGVDRLSVSFPVNSYEEDPSAWSMISARNPGTPQAAETRSASVELGPKVRAFVGVQELPTGQTWAKVEWNPSRVEDPEGHSLCPVDAVQSTAAAALAAAGDLVEVPPDPGTAKVRRIDVARDFQGVERPDFFVRSLGPLPRPWARRNLVHFDPSRNGAQTLMVGSGAGVARLYDKNAETEGNAPGVLRWEVEARSSWAKNYGEVVVLADVRAERVKQLAANRWEWSQMGVEVSAPDRVIEKVSNSGLSAAKQRSFLGWLFLQAHGVEQPIADATVAEWRRLQRQLGVTLTREDGTPAIGFVTRLDWDSGREVVRVA